MDEIYGGLAASGPNEKLSGSKLGGLGAAASVPQPPVPQAAVPQPATQTPEVAEATPFAPEPIEIADAPVAAESPAAEVASAEFMSDVPETTEEAPVTEVKTSSAFLGGPPTKKGRRPGRSFRLLRFAAGFVLAAAAVVLLMVGAAAAIRAQYADRVAPGVHVGAVDVSGLTRDEAVARLKTEYAYLGQGEVSVATASGTSTISYAKTGRGPDVDAMVYQALRVGHTGDPVADTVALLRGALNSDTIPIAVSLDPKAVATEVRQLVTTNTKPQNASASVSATGFKLNPAVDGKGIDEVAISRSIVEHLGTPGQSSSFEAGGAFIILKPEVSDADAQAAIASAQRMDVDIQLTYTKQTFATASPDSSASATASATPTPTPSPTATPTPPVTKKYTIPKATVLTWLSFGFDAQGKYVASVDQAKIQATVGSMNLDVTSAPIEPSVTFDSTGKPAGVTGGVPGAGLDTGATSQAIATYLASLASGGSTGPVGIVTVPVEPQLTPATLTSMVIIGAHTTTFYPDISNGNGKNIRQPATNFNGQVVQPGAQFSFLQRVGPIDEAHGFALGGVILRGKSDHTGAMGGGICSASTTVFNAAVKAGLKIDERHNHAYYINRYPVGLDATVFSNGYSTYDMKWTNDTANPIVIRSWSTKGSKSTITVQLWSLPTGRTTTFTPEFKANVVKASDSTQYTTSIPVGTKNRAEYPTDGFDTSRTRTVTDASGNVIHTDTWKSHYTKVDGILQIGVASLPSTPPSNPTPAPSSGLVLLPLAGLLSRRRSPLEER